MKLANFIRNKMTLMKLAQELDKGVSTGTDGEDAVEDVLRDAFYTRLELDLMEKKGRRLPPQQDILLNELNGFVKAELARRGIAMARKSRVSIYQDFFGNMKQDGAEKRIHFFVRTRNGKLIEKKAPSRRRNFPKARKMVDEFFAQVFDLSVKDKGKWQFYSTRDIQNALNGGDDGSRPFMVEYIAEKYGFNEIVCYKEKDFLLLPPAKGDWRGKDALPPEGNPRFQQTLF